MNQNKISASVIKRLPRYYRFLGELKNEGILKISSGFLAERMGLTASQIRQDLSCFGGFGQQGYGYSTELLRLEIGRILGLDALRPLILIGVGSMGKAAALNIRFEELGFQLIGLFDEKEALAGQMVRNIPIRNVAALDEFCRENKPKAAILCIPKDEAQKTAEQLIKLGIKGFLNLGNYELNLKNSDVFIENINLGDALMTLSYNLI